LRHESDLQLADFERSVFGGEAQGRVVHVDYLPRSLLLLLARAARATLFPSLYEGFGLPVLESMTLGTPVLTSTTSSLPELTGKDGAHLVDPYDVQAIARGIRDLDSSELLRRELIEKALQRAALFSRGPYEERLLKLYNRIR
jgi:glycosyltransferase involved in cell wall biosynthesis